MFHFVFFVKIIIQDVYKQCKVLVQAIYNFLLSFAEAWYNDYIFKFKFVTFIIKTTVLTSDIQGSKLTFEVHCLLGQLLFKLLLPPPKNVLALF